MNKSGQFTKVLVANRGEIAVRVIKACHELGLKAIAVYSEADQNALHVQMADAAYCIGPAPVAASYLNQAALIKAAQRAGAQAIHPGYGFLAENPEFAAACAAAGLVFIGPPAAAIRAMADKSAAKRALEAAGIPVVPGYHGTDQGLDALAAAARRIGYPVLIKAAAGGGGRGMRVVETPRDLLDAVESARREAITAFGDGRLLLERYLRQPRHIEVQVLADAYGHVIHLGERECSVQRRHQKVIEEAPAPHLDAPTRAALGDAAVRVAQRIGYRNAGTVEFLLDTDGRFYFLEMNTRLQVEHGVTELVTGVDIVQAQLRIARGEPLPWTQEEVALRGQAIQCRIYAEDPYRQFLPLTGRILVFEPPQGSAIRNDVGTYSGDEVSPYYDPLLAKLLVWGADREQALRRLRWALEHYVLLGVQTNLPLLRHILEQEAFRSGRIDVNWLEREVLPAFGPPPDPPFAVLMGAALAEVLGKTAPMAGSPWQQLGAWRGVGAGFVQTYEWNGRRYGVAVWREGATWRVRCGDQERRVAARLPRPDTLLLNEDGRTLRLHIASHGSTLFIAQSGQSFALQRPRALTPESGRTSGTAAGSRVLVAPLPGVVVRLQVRDGDQVRAHQVLVVLEAMKMEHALGAPLAGVVRRVNCREGERVAEGAVLVEIEPV